MLQVEFRRISQCPGIRVGLILNRSVLREQVFRRARIVPGRRAYPGLEDTKSGFSELRLCRPFGAPSGELLF